MDWLGQRQEQSRLGQILLGKKLISEEQLAQAIAAQRSSGKRLGEVLAELKLITDAQVRGAMRRQRNLRMAAALAGALLAPVQALAASAGAAPPVVQRGMTALSDAELGKVAGQGAGEDGLRLQAQHAERLLAALQQLHANAAASQHGKHDDNGGARVLAQLATLFNPMAGLLNADVSVKDVKVDPAQARAVVNKDGSVTFYLPSSIGEIQLRNIRVGRSASGPSFGSLQIRDIDLRGTSLTVRRI
ncbi:hypothetical protein NX773_09040 [Massilia solisilvae]|uniref:Uncharacterized protein n=1 Tax=Massilia solisilvae TaxID=1811225 RepID=A0ABT2BII9_9BURK|nr:hypothetical protein [Massilia solisilvae]MCS0608309.1 hypothetical protein [Massilia solisilvae]